MAINQSTRANLQTVNVRFSAFLGCMYISNPETEGALGTVKSQIGEDTWKGGFCGLASGSPSSKARALLNEANVPMADAGLSGRLISVALKMRQVADGEMPYLNVGITDDKETDFLSVDLQNAGAQMLVRKLANVAYGTNVSLNLFSTYEQKEGKPRAYAEHCATLKVGLKDGKEVVGVDPREELVPAKEAAKASLEKIPGILPEVVRKQLDGVERKYHADLLSVIEQRFSKERDEAKASRPQQPAPAGA